MGRLTPTYKKALYDELIDNIISNTSQYYAFASHPIPLPPNTAPDPVSGDDYSVDFLNNWYMLFGKKLDEKDFAPLVYKNLWTPYQVWDRYDNRDPNVLTKNRFYCLAPPTDPDGDYYYYKCIDNNNGGPSKVNPATHGTPMQKTTFKTSDDYEWRYIAKITTEQFGKFSTTDFAPIYPDPTIVSEAFTHCSVDKVVVANAGIQYDNWISNAVVCSISNTTVIQVDDGNGVNKCQAINQYYTNSSIYFYNNFESSGQIFRIKDYYLQNKSAFVVLDGEANTDNINPGTTRFDIAPTITFEVDGGAETHAPVGRVIIDSMVPNTSQSNSFLKIQMLDTGAAITWCNVSINNAPDHGYGAVVYAVVPPPGGHGANPAVELNMIGYGINIMFRNTEANTIPSDNLLYNKIGILKNPCILTETGNKGTQFFNKTYSNLLVANVQYTFEKGQTIYGANTDSRGYILFANSTQIWMVGDKTFETGETLKNANGTLQGRINIVTKGDIYTKDITPLYAQNINNIERNSKQSESYKLILQI